MPAGVATREGSRTASPEARAKPPGDYPCWDDYMHDAVQDAPTFDETAARGLKAMRLAPTLAVYKALLAGQSVPADAMDQQWLRRYTR